MSLLAPWVTHTDLPASRPALDSDPATSDAEWDRLGLVASSILYARTARRWPGAGARTVELVPPPGPGWLLRSPPIVDGWVGGAYGGSLVELAWLDIVGAGIAGDWAGLRRRMPVELRLPDYPVRAVDSVTQGGAVIAPAAYRLRDRRWLVRTDGGLWAADCGCETDAPGTGITVAYHYGQPPPVGGVEAAKLLTVQLGLAAADSPDCQLPANVVSVTRQGTTTRYVTLIEMLREGATGLPLVDLWVKAVNPDGRRRRARYWSPDTEPRVYPVA